MKRTEEITETRTVWRCDLCDHQLDTEQDGTAPARMPLSLMPVRGHGRQPFGAFRLDSAGFIVGVHQGNPALALDLCDHCAVDLSAWMQSRADDNRGSVTR